MMSINNNRHHYSPVDSCTISKKIYTTKSYLAISSLVTNFTPGFDLKTSPNLLYKIYSKLSKQKKGDLVPKHRTHYDSTADLF